jgi:hypothetical protein
MTLDIATRRKWLDDGIALARMIDDQIMIFGTFLFVVWADQNDDFWNR